MLIIEENLDDGVISLRCLQSEDIGENYLHWLRDKDINQFLEVRHNLPTSVSELQDYVSSINESQNNIMLGIFTNNNKHIGNIKLGPIDKINKRAEVGIILGDKSEWGKGYGTRAIKIASEYAIESLGLIRLTAGMHEPNQGSFRAFEKAGYTYEGTSKSYWQSDDGRLDQLWLCLVKE